MKKIKEWAENYKRYIKFQCEVLPHAYEYGGRNFRNVDFPSFKEFEGKLGNKDYDYCNFFFAEEHNYKGENKEYWNKLNFCFRPDLYKYKLYYSVFRGVRWNFKKEF